MRDWAAGLVCTLTALGACAHATGSVDGSGEDTGATGAGGGRSTSVGVLVPNSATAHGGAAGSTAAATGSDAGGAAPTTSPLCPAVQSCSTRSEADYCTEYDDGWDKLEVQSQCGSAYVATPCDEKGSIGGCLSVDGNRCSIVWYYPPTFAESTLSALCQGEGKQPVPAPN
jgi:hypothetical protein